MRATSTPQFRSLKAKFVGLLLLGGLTAATIGGCITYKATNAQLQQRLLIRIDTLASALNHAAMVSVDWTVVQHMIEEVTKEQSDITDIMVVSDASRKIVAASMAPVIGINIQKLPDAHLRHELIDALDKDHFDAISNRIKVKVLPGI